jgi:hypothetical protein
MKKILIALTFGLLVMQTAHADWEQIGGSGQNGLYMDLSTLKDYDGRGKYFQVWTLQNTNDGGKIKSITSYELIDCSDRSSRAIQIGLYSGFGGTGRVIENNSYTIRETPFQYWAPNTFGDLKIKAVCKR